MLRHASHIIFEVFVAILAVSALLAAAGAWRLSQGPVSLSFLKPYFEEAIARQRSAYRFEIDDTILTWAGWRRPLDIRGTGTRMLTADGRVVATVPEVSVRFSFLALLRGRLAPTSFALINPRVRMVRSESGDFQLGFGEETDISGDILPGILAALSSPPDLDSAIGLLRRISIVGGNLSVDDRVLGVSWGSPLADIELARDGSRLRAGFDLDVGFDDSAVADHPRLTGAATFQPGGEQLDIEVAVDNLRPAHLAGRIPGLEAMELVDVPLKGSISVELAQGGTVQTAQYSVRGGAGRVKLADPGAEWVAVASIAARGGYERSSAQFVIDRLSLDLGGPVIDVSAVATRVGDVTAVSGDLTGRRLPLDEITRHWPAGMAPGARDWARANMEGGTTTARGNFSARVLHGESVKTAFDSMSITLNLRGTTVHYLKPLPPVRNIRATIVVGLDRADIAVQHGTLNGLDISDGTIAMTALDQDMSWLDLEAVIRGPLRNALDVLDHPRLNFIRGRGIDPATVEGRSASRLVVRLPLLRDLDIADLSVKAAANMRDVKIPGLLLGTGLADGKLQLRLDNDAMSIAGSADVAGARADLTWFERFDSKSPFLRRYDLKSTFTEKNLRRFGLDLGKSLRGKMEVDVVFIERRNSRADVRVRFGLDDTAMSLPVLGWSKTPGKASSASFDLTLRNGRLHKVTKFDVFSETLRVGGDAEFSADGESLQRMNIHELMIAGRGQITARASRGPSGRMIIRIKGKHVDVQPFIKSLDEGTELSLDLPALDIKAHFGEMLVRPDVAFRNVEAALSYDGARWSNIFAVSTIGRQLKVGVGFIDRGDSLNFSMESTDAGEALRLLGVVDNLNGGKLELTASRTRAVKDSPWRGRLRVSDVRITDAPSLVRLLSLASLTGISDVLAGRGLIFSRLDMPFSLTAERLEIARARAVGSAIGITADGDVDLVSERVKLKGTLVPAYTINSVLGNIPLLGTLITGEQGGGIFAATYAIDGPLEGPKISVNPLAALAPGFLRNLFRGLTEGGAPPPLTPDSPPQE